MKNIKVQFASVNQIVRFVNIVERYDADIDLRCGRIVVDAKSLLGVMSFGVQKQLEMQLPDESPEELLNRIRFCTV